MSPSVQQWIDRIDQAAARPGDSAPVRLQKTLLIFLGVAGLLVVPWGAHYLYGQGFVSAAFAVAAYSVLSAAGLLHLLLTKTQRLSSWLQLVSLLFVPFLGQWTMGGFHASGGLVLWSLLSPLCALVFRGTREAVWWFGVYAVLVLVSTARDIGDGVAEAQVLLFTENTLLVSVIAFISLRFFVVERDKARAALEREHERAEGLLLNILPPPIARRLKDSHQTIADGYAEATVLFADIVGFTHLSTTIPPAQLVDLLNRLFSSFDELSAQYGVEKIKTIGDAYMACAGVPIERPDHAQAIADLALAMQQSVQNYNQGHGADFQIRVGINTGPVVAGVIGLKKFIYDLWGDTVNLASRMESTGIPNGIQVSASTYEKLRKGYRFEERGTVEAKGIGSVQAYLLKGRID